MRRSSKGRCSGSNLSARRFRRSVVRSFDDSLDILLRLAGGGPSPFFAEWAPSMTSGDGDPLCEVCCDAGGEGYGNEVGDLNPGTSSGGGDGELLNMLKGEEGALEGSEDKSEESSIISVGRVSLLKGDCRRAQYRDEQGRRIGCRQCYSAESIAWGRLSSRWFKLAGTNAQGCENCRCRFASRWLRARSGV